MAAEPFYNSTSKTKQNKRNTCLMMSLNVIKTRLPFSINSYWCNHVLYSLFLWNHRLHLKRILKYFSISKDQNHWDRMLKKKYSRKLQSYIGTSKVTLIAWPLIEIMKFSVHNFLRMMVHINQNTFHSKIIKHRSKQSWSNKDYNTQFYRKTKWIFYGSPSHGRSTDRITILIRHSHR